MEVGIIGVGLMGHGIARNVLRRGGFGLNFFNHAGNQPVDELLNLGARPFDSLAELASASDVVILCVTGSPQVEAVLTGTDGVNVGLHAGSCAERLPPTACRIGWSSTKAGPI